MTIRKLVTQTLHCKHCDTNFIVRDAAETIGLYVSCCKDCWEAGIPQQKRFDYMAEQMGPRWAIDHY